MRKVILTVGPRGAGKSTFCEKVLEAYPMIEWVSRDEILLNLCGTTYPDTGSGHHEQARAHVLELLARYLKRVEVTIILDAYNSYASERVAICRHLHNLGAEHIEAWRFITPASQVAEWFVSRMTRDLSPEEFANDYNALLVSAAQERWLFNTERVTLAQGFNLIREINPLTDKPEEIFQPR